MDASDASFDGRSVWEVFVAGVAALLPDLARPWLAVLAVAPLSILVPAGVIWLVKRLSAGREAKLRDGMRIAWREAANGVPVSGKADSRLRRQRTSRPYQLILQTLKWRIMPNVIGPLLILGFFWFLLVVFTQVRLVRDERGTSVCAATPVADLVEPSPEQGRLFHTDRACQRTKMRVRKGHRYQIEFKMVRQWQDGAHLASPLGLNSSDFPAGSWWKMYPASMLRRVVSARWMQPLYEIRAPATADGSRPRIFIDKLDLTRSGTAYIAQFEARLDGELMLFVNEATLPWQPVSYFYLSEPSGVNLGTALVQVTSLSPPDTAELPTGTTQQ